jgi:hypothetical protein
VKRIYVRGELLERIAPGIYRGAGGVCHLVLDELLEENGIENTPENQAMMIAAARDLLAAQDPPVTLEVFD